jgi:hypothetical protein
MPEPVQTQVLLWHCWPAVHGLSQPPQWLLSAVVLTHAVPQRVGNAGAQMQALPWQMRLAPQLFPQVLQFSGSFEVFTHCAPHLVYGLLQVNPQVPLQVATPLLGGVHTVPQLPQLYVSVFRFLHWLPHLA